MASLVVMELGEGAMAVDMEETMAVMEEALVNTAEEHMVLEDMVVQEPVLGE